MDSDRRLVMTTMKNPELLQCRSNIAAIWLSVGTVKNTHIYQIAIAVAAVHQTAKAYYNLGMSAFQPCV